MRSLYRTYNFSVPNISNVSKVKVNMVTFERGGVRLFGVLFRLVKSRIVVSIALF